MHFFLRSRESKSALPDLEEPGNAADGVGDDEEDEHVKEVKDNQENLTEEKEDR